MHERVLDLYVTVVFQIFFFLIHVYARYAN